MYVCFGLVTQRTLRVDFVGHVLHIRLRTTPASLRCDQLLPHGTNALSERKDHCGANRATIR